MTASKFFSKKSTARKNRNSTAWVMTAETTMIISRFGRISGEVNLNYWHLDQISPASLRRLLTVLYGNSPEVIASMIAKIQGIIDRREENARLDEAAYNGMRRPCEPEGRFVNILMAWDAALAENCEFNNARLDAAAEIEIANGSYISDKQVRVGAEFWFIADIETAHYEALIEKNWREAMAASIERTNAQYEELLITNPLIIRPSEPISRIENIETAMMSAWEENEGVNADFFYRNWWAVRYCEPTTYQKSKESCWLWAHQENAAFDAKREQDAAAERAEMTDPDDLSWQWAGVEAYERRPAAPAAANPTDRSAEEIRAGYIACIELAWDFAIEDYERFAAADFSDPLTLRPGEPTTRLESVEFCQKRATSEYARRHQPALIENVETARALATREDSKRLQDALGALLHKFGYGRGKIAT